MAARGRSVAARFGRTALLASPIALAIVAGLTYGVPGSALPTTAGLDCSVGAIFGSPTECTVSADGATSIVWGDGETTPLATADGRAVRVDRVIDAVGSIVIQVVDEDSTVLTSAVVTVIPDLELSCEAEAPKNIYKLVAADTKSGWDYVYVHPETGAHVGPGDPDHPVDPGFTDWELVTQGRAAETGMCTATSEAAERFDATTKFTMASAWEEHSVPFLRLKPWSDLHWKGTQPGTIEVSVTINGVTASERRGVFFSGCN